MTFNITRYCFNFKVVIITLLIVAPTQINAAAGESNIYDAFPVGIGTITINDSLLAPQYKFKNASLITNAANALVSAPVLSLGNMPAAKDAGKLLPLGGILKGLADVTLADNEQFVIETFVNPEKFYSMSGTYYGGQTKKLVLQGSFQDKENTNNQWAACYLDFNLFQLLKKAVIDIQPASSGVLFKWVLINPAFDTAGTFLTIDSVDVYYVTYKKDTSLEAAAAQLAGATTAGPAHAGDKILQGDQILHISRITIKTAGPMTSTVPNPLWTDKSIFDTDCVTP